MTSLEPDNDLTNYALKLLAAADIRTVHEFIAESSVNLSKITNLSASNIAEILCRLRKCYGPQRCRHLWPTATRTAVYQTGIRQLDEMLGLSSPLAAGSVWEICGTAGIGKTQLCHALSLNFVSERMDDASTVLYIDTKGDFSGTRIRQMLRFRTADTSKCGRHMQQIKVERTLTATGVIDILEELLRLRQHEASAEADNEASDIKLVVIDSLSAVWFRFNSDNERLKGKYLLELLANLVYRLSMQHLAFVMVNLSLAKKNPLLEKDLQQSVADAKMDVANECDDNVQLHDTGSGEEPVAQRIRPALGQYWSSVPRLRLSVEMPSKTNGPDDDEAGVQGSARIITVLQSCSSRTGLSCQVRITNAGVE